MSVTTRRMARLLNHRDLRRAAQRRLPRAIFDYVDGGSEDELTLRWNRDAFERIAMVPRGAVWVPEPVTEVTVFGDRVAMPVLTAPAGGLRLLHPDGDLGVARAARDAGTIAVVTSASGYSLEEIAEVGGVQWFQAYRFSDAAAMRSLVGRAAAAGYRALVATVDTSVAANREKDFRNGFSYDMRINLANIVRMAPRVIGHPSWAMRFVLDGMPFVLPNTADLTMNGKPLELSALTRAAKDSHSPTWEDIEWMRANWDGPLVVKGVLSVDDARCAMRLGADGIVVSNHGGRQFDGAPATMSVLPEIVDAVGDAVTVILDSGVRRGTDVLKALAAGAQAVLVGRMCAYGLGAGGEAGAARALSILRSDLVRSMQLLGCSSVADLDSTWLATSPEVRR